MRVHITFDVEVWCPGWLGLDDTFPAAFERYVWGHSCAGDYALPRNLEILRRHGLAGVFFVEPLFSFRFGRKHLQTIVDLIQAAGQDVQLHLHPEWVDEIKPALIENCRTKRQHLTDYFLEEQIALLDTARQALADAARQPITAFRSGGYAANRQTYSALAAVGIGIDSSLNATFDHSAGTIGPKESLRERQLINGVQVHPITVFKDALGKSRHLQVGACSFREMQQVLDRGYDSGLQEVVFVSHNFELMRPGGASPDRIVERRFDRLCSYLAGHPDRFEVGPFRHLPEVGVAARDGAMNRLRASPLATGLRLCEQLARRIG